KYLTNDNNKIIEQDNKLIYTYNSIDAQLDAYNNLSVVDSYFDYTLVTYTDIPAWLVKIGASPMFLGLDLKGGVHFLLQVDESNIKKNLLREFESDIKKELIESKIRYKSFERSKDQLRIIFKDSETLDSAKTLLESNTRDFIIMPDSNSNLNILISDEALSRDLKSSIAKNLTILRSRVDELGVSQPIVQKQGKDRIIVQLPGLQDSTRAKNILGSTATLEFRLTKGTPEDWLQSLNQNIPSINSSKLYKQRDGSPVLLSRKIIVGGADIKNANSGFDSTTNSPAVFVTLSDYGADQMLKTTQKNIGKRMAVVFVEKNKEEVINIAVIREAFSKSFQITGLNREEAQNLSILLRSGALSAPMEIVEERTVGPSLGEENILAGKNSMYFGMLLVVLFMFFYYRIFGFIANIALFANLIIIIAILSVFQATLTLSGIAGIVLTVGMAVDANVLIFERIREEILNGNSPNSSIYAGYKKAFSTISDAKITTLIAAISLLTIGTGVVKGFAVTLVIGILSSMFTSIIGTRAIVSIIYENKKQTGLSI
ncbi:MAG: protein translocase subunit SecD, partial [Pseudomonadota bacterium]|nr:protein translocase subunit SecD [Pseudomonadota bacterium]